MYLDLYVLRHLQGAACQVIRGDVYHAELISFFYSTYVGTVGVNQTTLIGEVKTKTMNV